MVVGGGTIGDDKVVHLEPVVPVAIRRLPASQLGVRPQPEDCALFLHTSGTTGRPKGSLIHRSIDQMNERMNELFNACK